MVYISNYVLNIALTIIIMTNIVITKSVTTDKMLLSNEENRDLIKLNGSRKNDSVVDKSVAPRKSEARDTRWSWYYVAAWEWHLPLWFLLYFVWYLVFCTVRSIYNHTINPDDYLRRRRSAENNWDMNQLTQFALNAIENFPNKISRFSKE